MSSDAETQARRRRASDQQQAFFASHGIAPPQAFDAMDGILAEMPLDRAQAPAEPEGEGHDPVVFLHPAMLPGATRDFDSRVIMVQILTLLREIRAAQVVSDERFATLLLLEERFDTVRYGPAAPADAPGPPPAE